jgi:predicted nucleic acid-binding protein
MVAETLNVNCIGSIGLLIKAKQKGLIPELKPIFEKWILMGRYFSIKLLNSILLKFEEPKLFS